MNFRKKSNKAALLLNEDKLVSPSDIFQKILRDIYISDSDFSNIFSTYSINTNKDKKLARYVLYKLEHQMGGASYDFELNEGTIEHILPENLEINWEAFFNSEQHEEFVFAIGNLTLLEEGKNRGIGQRLFQEKKEVFKTSQFKLSNSIDSAEWTPKAVKIRQDAFAKTAKTIWRVPYLS